MMKRKLVKVSILTMALGLVGGCGVTEEQLDEVRATAETALSEARSAQSRADNAHEVASEAAFAASEAQKGIQTAMDCCNENSARLDRMFEKAMKK